MKRTQMTAVRSGPRPRVTILMLTYNHARYIEEAIRSVFQQKPDFEFELLIADDCSTDKTVWIARSLQRQFSGISLYCARKNRGMYHNLARIFYRARGEYIAFLEGDDFWLSSDKLQRQVEQLEADRGAVLCFHQAKLMENGEITGAVFPNLSQRVLTFEHLLGENCIPTCSAVFRRSALPLMPSWCADLKLLDWPLFLLLAQRGKVIFLPEELSVYRIHPAGDWSQLAPHRKSERMIEVLRCIREQIGKEFAGKIDRRISALYEHISWCFEERNALDEALAASWKATVAASFTNPQSLRGCLRLAIRAILPLRGMASSLLPSGTR